MTDTMSLRNAQEREAAAQRAKVERANREEADWQLCCADSEAERQRAKVELARREAETRKQQQPAFDWPARLGLIDQCIASVTDAQGIFSEVQRDVLVTIVNEARDDMREQVSKAIDDLRAAVDARLEALERRVRAPGVLPPIKVWEPRAIFYAGELVTFDGQVYQALANTGVRPDDKEFWICIARAGTDAVQVAPKGEWNAVVSYELLNLVSYEGCPYLATRDNPGRPGGESGWQAVAAKGARGNPGPRGNRGAAETPVTIVGWALDVEDYRACPALSNGEVGAILDLRPLFEQFHDETGTA